MAASKQQSYPSAWLVRLNRTSPRLLRLMARSLDGMSWASNRELALRAGCCEALIAKLTTLDVWDDVPSGIIARYAEACGIDLLKPRTCMYFRNRRSRAYLKTMTAQQRRLAARLQAGVLRTLTHGKK